MGFILKAFNRIIGEPQNVHATGNALHILDEEDAAIHQGEGWIFGSKFALAPAATTIFDGPTTPAKRVHFQDFSISATTGPIDISYFKDSVISSGTGAEVFAINRRFDITSSSDMRIFTGVTLTTTGTLVSVTANLASPAVGGRTNPTAAGVFPGYFIYNEPSYI